jgi:murein DD-endopeptidase MepM/ murein hydrolase activator NlpD
MILKSFLHRAVLALRTVFFWLGRHIFLPVLIRAYRLIGRCRRALRPAERRFVLIATHRGILHGTIIAVALTTAGGNLYAQSQSSVSSGEQSVLYRFITGDEQNVEVSGLPTLAHEMQYVSDAVDANSAPEPAGLDHIITEEDAYQGSEAMIELGALMPEAIPGASAPVHRTQTEYYTVADGDTLSGIATKFGVSIATILWENNLTVRDFIKPGQKLTILPSSGVSYKIKKGDTIAKVAVVYGVDPTEIKSWNGISDDSSLQIGAQIFVPGGKVATPAAPPKPKTVAVAPKAAAKPSVVQSPGASGADMAWPAATHYISQPYGIWSRVSGGTHSGVDLAAATGTLIYAADDGIVTHAGCGASCKKSYGLYVDIDHGNGLMTRYGHASKLAVSVGDQVRRGQVIAYMGSTGRSTGPHLHFEVRKNGRYVNPMPYIR